MSKIVKELGKVQEKELKEIASDKAVTEVKALLTESSAEDRNILKTMGLDTHLEIADNKHTKLIELNELNSKYNGHVYHIDTIKKLAVDYRLRFLNTRRYKGAINVEVPAKIKAFAKENNIELNPSTLEYKFFMLAPAEDFDIRDVKKIIPHKDPALFFKVDDSHYRLIHKWGGDFTPLRLLQGWRWKNRRNFWFFSILVGFLFASIIAPIIMPLSTFADGSYWIAWGILFVIAILLTQSDNWNEDGAFMEENTSPNNWHSTDRYR